MAEVDVHHAKTQLSKPLRRVAAGEEIVIGRAGKPVARLVPYARPGVRRLGVDVGKFEIPEDFDEPLPDDLLEKLPILTADDTFDKYDVDRLRP